MPASEDTPPVLRFGPFALDMGNARLSRDGEPIEVVPKDLDVLDVLVRRAGRLVAKDELLDAVWKHRFVSESVLKNGISRLRTLLGDDARQPRYIETAQRRGYRFIAEVSLTAPSAPAGAAALTIRSPAGRPSPASKSPVASGAPLSPLALVGRADALAWLHERLAACADRTHLALLSGEAGIGKTTLIEAFVEEAADAHEAWLAFGQCVEHSGAVEPYLPVLEALGDLCKAHPDAGLVDAMRQVAPTWLVQLPWFMTADDRRQLLQEVSGATRERMLRELGELLDRISAGRPVILVIEDLHWSDPATLQLIGFLARRRGAARVLLLASLRPAEIIAGDHPLKALRQALRQQRLCEELELALFSERDAADYLAARFAGSAWPEPLVRALHDHTGGLPLFVVALLDELFENRDVGGVATTDAAPADRLERLGQVPRSIFGLIEQQHARLPEEGQRWLEAASAAGVEFAHLPLADALDVEAEKVEAFLDRLARAGTWLREIDAAPLPDGRITARYAFRHAVHRNVLYHLTPAARRVALHRRLASALERAYAADPGSAAAEMAIHFEKGQEPAHAVRQLAVAAQRALRRFAASEAATIASHGLRLLEPLAERPALREVEVELNVELGVAMTVLKGITAEESAGAFTRAAVLLDDSRPSPARIAALHGIWWLTLARGKFDRACDMAGRALAMAERHGDAALAFAGHSAMGITLAHIGDAVAAHEHLDLALDLLPAPETLPEAMFTFDPAVQLMCYQSMTHWSLGQPTLAATKARKALERAERLRHPTTMIIASVFSGLHHAATGDFAQLRSLTDRALRACAEQHLERGAGALLWLNGRAMVDLGVVDEGLARMNEGLAVQRRHGHGYGLTRWHENHGHACRQARRTDEALASVDEGLALAESSREHASSAELHRLRGDLLAGRGDLAGAIEAFARARAVAARQGALHFEIAALAARCSLPQPDDDEAASELSALLERWTDPWEPATIVAARAALVARRPVSKQRGR